MRDGGFGAGMASIRRGTKGNERGGELI